MKAAPPCSVGLVGDGDEIYAIEDVEEAFGVTLDHEGASEWRTAGDVFASLLKVLPPGASGDGTLWERFAAAIALETGIDPRQIAPESPLLLPDKGIWGHVKDALLFIAVMWLAILLLRVAF